MNLSYEKASEVYGAHLDWGSGVHQLHCAGRARKADRRGVAADAGMARGW